MESHGGSVHPGTLHHLPTTVECFNINCSIRFCQHKSSCIDLFQLLLFNTCIQFLNSLKRLSSVPICVSSVKYKSVSFSDEFQTDVERYFDISL